MGITFNLYRNADGSLDGRYKQGDKPSTWQLPSTNSVQSLGIPLSFVNSNEDASCSQYAIHRNAYPSIAWDHMLGVHGGKFPYYIELLQSPSGMTVGSSMSVSGDVLVFDNDYMRLRWSNPTTGSHTIQVRVTDQAGAQISRTWTLVVGTANWVFVDPVSGNDSTGDGSSGNPFATDAPLNTGYANKLVYVRGGTFNLNGGGGNYSMDGTRPSVFIGYPSESAIVTQNDNWFVMSTDDCAIKNLEIKHGTMTAATADRKCISQIGDSDRGEIVDILFSNYEYGANNAANGAVISSLGGVNNDQFVHNIEVTGNTGTVYQSFKHRNALIQKINIHNAVLANTDSSSNNGAIRLKDGWANLTIRLCEAWDNNSWTGNNGFINAHGQDQSSLVIGATDICYNSGYFPSTGLRDGALIMWSYGTVSNLVDDIHVYRNSFRGDVGENCYTYDVGTIAAQRDENNVFENGLEATAPEVTNVGNLDGATVYFDASLKLTGASRTSYLGTKGAEVA